ncbi:MAG TPA: hypothetical protein VEI01_02440 [Terriglobales bacterium]|nr:hypothetical protein [Terriglobales bacterium]
MPLLILAIASFLLFPLILVLLCIAHVLESRAIRQNRTPTSARAPLLSIAEAFDPVYSVLWDAPIAALELIDSAGPAGIPVARLRPIYAAAAAHFPEIYEGCSFVHWLQFLEKTRLISWQGYRAVLTPDGHAFLRFRFVTDAMVEA